MDLVTFDVFKNMAPREGMVELDDAQLRDLQDALYGALVDIDAVCRENGIEYWLCGGSVLGAVRHAGFIPWDDDIDLYMTRDAYRRFESLFDENLGDGYLLITPWRDERCLVSVPQVRKRGTYVRLRDDLELDDASCGACIDIFILDNAPNNAILRRLHGIGSLLLGLVASCRKFHRYRSWFLDLAGDDGQTARTFKTKAVIGGLFAWRSPNAWANAWDAWNGLCRDNRSRFLVDPTGRTHYFGSLRRREVFQPAARLLFRGLSAPVPHDYEAYLTQHYGPDFMQPPADGHRERHVVFGFDVGDAARPPIA